MFLGIKRYEEQVIEDEQLATFNLLEFRFKYPFDFYNFQCTQQFRYIGIGESGILFYTPRDQGCTSDSFFPYQEKR